MTFAIVTALILAAQVIEVPRPYRKRRNRFEVTKNGPLMDQISRPSSH